MTNAVDTHDPVGMAGWLRERKSAVVEFLALDSETQQRQYLAKWQQNVLPHLAFRFEQAAQLIESLNTKRLQVEHERDVAVERLADLQRTLLGPPELAPGGASQCTAPNAPIESGTVGAPTHEPRDEHGVCPACRAGTVDHGKRVHAEGCPELNRRGES